MKISMIPRVTMFLLSAFATAALHAEPKAEPKKTETQKTEVEKDKPKPLKIDGITFEGGDGSSPEKAIIIKGAKNSFEGIQAESKYAAKKHRDFKKGGQALVSENGKSYDRISYTNAKGESLTLYFDISDFFGK